MTHNTHNVFWRLDEWAKDTPSQIREQLKIYHSELLKFNLRVNLIARATERDADEVHFSDCLVACQMITKAGVGNKTVHDIGSGNGLPGVILAILNPTTAVNLIESDSRKCEFLKHVIAVLRLSQVKVMNLRLESLKTGEMTLAVTRGFASLSRTVLACNKVFSKGGRFYHLKGPGWSSEIAEMPSQLMSAWTPELIGEYLLPLSQARRAVICTSRTI